MLDRVLIPADVKEKPAGLMMDGVGALTRRREPASALRLCGRIGGGGRESSHPKEINDLLTIMIY